VIGGGQPNPPDISEVDIYSSLYIFQSRDAKRRSPLSRDLHSTRSIFPYSIQPAEQNRVTSVSALATDDKFLAITPHKTHTSAYTSDGRNEKGASGCEDYDTGSLPIPASYLATTIR